MSFNALSICFEMCTLCAVRRRWLGLTAYVRFMSSTCPAVAPFPTPLCRLTPVDRLDSNRIESSGLGKWKADSAVHSARLFLFFALVLSPLIIVVAEMVQSKPNQTAEFRAASWPAIFEWGDPFSDHSTHALNSFIQIHCTHQSQTTHTAHNAMSTVERRVRLKGGRLWRVLDSVSPSWTRQPCN